MTIFSIEFCSSQNLKGTTSWSAIVASNGGSAQGSCNVQRYEEDLETDRKGCRSLSRLVVYLCTNQG
jgi:hypothetical protein